MSPDRFLPIQKEIIRRADRYLGQDRGPPRIFLARKDSRHRRLVNAITIQAIAERKGFVIVYPEDWDFAQQARLLRGAQFVVGPEGSAFYLTYFQDAGTKMCLLCHELTESLVGYNAGCAPGELTIITGPTVNLHHENEHDADYTIDPEIFARFLDEWLAPYGVPEIAAVSS